MPLLPPGPSYILQTSISSKEGDIFISVCFLYHLVQDSEKKRDMKGLSEPKQYFSNLWGLSASPGACSRTSLQ